MTRISLIIPVLNEGASLRDFLERLQDWRALGHELILVDGGSNDGSPEIAAPYVDQLCRAKPSRAGQMNYGAERASGDALLFLHADTQLPERGLELLRAALAAGAQWGWFDVRFDNPALVFKMIAGFMNLRARWTRVCTGDQALFLTRKMFDRVGGFPQQSLMEDVAISKRLRQHAEPIVMSAKVETASRRWQQRGIISTILLMWDLRLRYFLGQSPESLHARYYPKD